MYVRKNFVIMKKKTLAEVKKYIEDCSYICLSNEYINNKEKLHVECPKGHTFYIRFSDFRQGGRCPICNINKQRKSLSYIKTYTEKRNYICLSEKYINNHTKLIFKCRNNHIFKMSWNKNYLIMIADVLIVEDLYLG